MCYGLLSLKAGIESLHSSVASIISSACIDQVHKYLLNGIDRIAMV